MLKELLWSLNNYISLFIIQQNKEIMTVAAFSKCWEKNIRILKIVKHFVVKIRHKQIRHYSGNFDLMKTVQCKLQGVTFKDRGMHF